MVLETKKKKKKPRRSIDTGAAVPELSLLPVRAFRSLFQSIASSRFFFFFFFDLFI